MVVVARTFAYSLYYKNIVEAVLLLYQCQSAQRVTAILQQGTVREGNTLVRGHTSNIKGLYTACEMERH